MEQDLIYDKNEILGTNNYFKVTYFNQDVKNKPEFKKWYKNLKEEINKDNFESNRSLLTIGFCMNCMSYTICSIMDFSYCYAICSKCKKTFCVGCLQDNNSCYNIADATICLKGFLKVFYLRIIYRRSQFQRAKISYKIMHIILCLFINKDHLLYHLIYSIIRGFLMFPYIILFFPYMFILLLPGIFSYSYYLYIYNAYVTALFPGPYPLENI